MNDQPITATEVLASRERHNRAFMQMMDRLSGIAERRHLVLAGAYWRLTKDKARERFVLGVMQSERAR